jgi:hypothetical protein
MMTEDLPLMTAAGKFWTCHLALELLPVCELPCVYLRILHVLAKIRKMPLHEQLIYRRALCQSSKVGQRTGRTIVDRDLEWFFWLLGRRPWHRFLGRLSLA